MEPGYAIALCLECAGALTFATALRIRRTERRERASALRRGLGSGGARARTPRAIPLAPGPAAAAPAGPSDARLALRRAFGMADRETGLSAAGR
ncbi:hypothetical protein [Methylobacterium trifolii]|uniref:Uncharacterized protein n=1 Tax=Methylobacterium trifolii TaxID=1003092 RepID=A0ABQ4TZT4_9HYPH|nr:hypothetical protein [Methylobacterium trifolii]GJE59370.1 hypothetical protein MPOCJGCO_1461 [Methylobacterium trifolii]